MNSAILGRFRSDFVPRGPATQPEWPPPGEPVRVAIRAVTLDDLAAWTALHRAPSTVWGTLQLPSATEDSWRDRLQRNTVIGQHGIVAVLDGRVVGSGGIHRLPFPADHAATLGMSVHADFQGRRVGGQILDALVAQGQALGLSRIELEVYADNPRAIALYRSRGFVEEGVRRKNALRDGAHVDSLVMAITR